MRCWDGVHKLGGRRWAAMVLLGVVLTAANTVKIQAAKSRRLLQLPVDCQVGQFLKIFPENMCMDCDPNCIPEECVDSQGCERCIEGYYTSRADPFWPFRCLKCPIADCSQCKENVGDYEPVECAVCNENFILSERNTLCIKDDNITTTTTTKTFTTAPDVVETNRTFFMVDENATSFRDFFTVADNVTTNRSFFTVQGDDPSLGGVTQSGCGANQFRKKRNNMCMDCDVNCAEGQCVDFDGCKKCKEGFYRSRRDDDWPYQCLRCSASISNCSQCKDPNFDTIPPECETCVAGYTVSDDRLKCVTVQ